MDGWVAQVSILRPGKARISIGLEKARLYNLVKKFTQEWLCNKGLTFSQADKAYIMKVGFNPCGNAVRISYALRIGRA